MACTQTIFFLLGIVLRLEDPSSCGPTQFRFLDETWTFPATVQQAVFDHHLNYKPPGGYFKKDASHNEIILDYHYQGGDFINEYQPKETLYSRQLHSYVFGFKEQTNTYDSLKLVLEQSFDKKFVLVQGIKDSELVAPENKPFAYNLMTVSDCLTIGIKRSSPRRKEKTVTVRFMYNLPLGKIGIHMGNF
jgi:hypothetical protein